MVKRERSQFLPRRLFVASLRAPATSLVARQKPAVTRRMAPSNTNRHTSKPLRKQETLIHVFSAELRKNCSILGCSKSARRARGEERREKREGRRDRGGGGCVDEMHYLSFSCSTRLQYSIECLLVF